MSDIDNNTRQLIFGAARKIFTRKGFGGARMQEIADEAGINKALLHYYFRNKDLLFESIFRDAIKSFIPGIMQTMKADLPFFEKIRLFVVQYIDNLSENPDLAGFILHELRANPQHLAENLIDFGIDIAFFGKQIEAEVAAGRIRPVKPEHLLVNIVSLTIFPFIARPVLMGINRMDDEHFRQFIEERKALVPGIIIQSLKPEK